MGLFFQPRGAAEGVAPVEGGAAIHTLTSTSPTVQYSTVRTHVLIPFFPSKMFFFRQKIKITKLQLPPPPPTVYPPLLPVVVTDSLSRV